MAQSTSVLEIDIVTPERRIYSGIGSLAVFPGAEGELGIMSGHAPLLSRLGTGEIKVVNGATVEYGVVSDGFLEVRKNRISVVAEYAVMAADIDTAEAESSRTAALAELETQKEGPAIKIAQSRLKLAVVKLSAASKARAGGKTEKN
jgi:F-type H+-transporting ATPase subunit epsilon